MKIIRIKDQFNPNKVWIVKRSKAGHYWFNQDNYGQLLLKKFERVSGSKLAESLCLTFDHLKQLIAKYDGREVMKVIVTSYAGGYDFASVEKIGTIEECRKYAAILLMTDPTLVDVRFGFVSIRSNMNQRTRANARLRKLYLSYVNEFQDSLRFQTHYDLDCKNATRIVRTGRKMYINERGFK